VPVNNVVINASPLIVLFKSHQAYLLPLLFREILVAEAVWQEVTASDQSDKAAQQLPRATWAKRVTTVTVNPQIASWDLGAGESEVLSLALERPGYYAMVDDMAARRCARTLDIPTLGTGATLILAKRQGLISSVSGAIQAVRDAGLWLSDDLVQLLKQQAGE
jgi:predicted nucleic acid-binding protein